MLLCFVLLLSQSVEVFEQRLADAEEAVYGQRREKDGAERRARESWRRSENESRERWRRREGDRTEREQRRGNERDSSPGHEERYHAREREEGREHQGKEDRFRDKDRGRGRDRERDKDIERNRKRDRSTDKEKETDRRGANSVFESHRSSSGAHRSHFLKPSEDDDRGEAIWNVMVINLCRHLIPLELKIYFTVTNVQFIMQNMVKGLTFLSCLSPETYPPPAQRSTGFLKPSSDDEDSASAWKKSNRPVQEVVSAKQQQENEMSPRKTETANQAVDKAVTTLERYCNLT